ncbi:MAG: hypothetical protein V1708_00755 [Candidatus Micrarchaeota archaeon]
MAQQQKTLVVRNVEQPARKNFNSDFEWLCECLGLTEGGKGDLAPVIFRQIVEAEKTGRPARSIVISRKFKVTRGGAVYHLNRLIETGLIVRHGREYELRAGNLTETMDEVEEDMLRMFRRMRGIARELDEEMGFVVRE